MCEVAVVTAGGVAAPAPAPAPAQPSFATQVTQAVCSMFGGLCSASQSIANGQSRLAQGDIAAALQEKGSETALAKQASRTSSSEALGNSSDFADGIRATRMYGKPT